MYQTCHVSLGSKGTAHLTQADVRQGVSKFSTLTNTALVPGLCQPPHPCGPSCLCAGELPSELLSLTWELRALQTCWCHGNQSPERQRLAPPSGLHQAQGHQARGDGHTDTQIQTQPRAEGGTVTHSGANLAVREQDGAGRLRAEVWRSDVMLSVYFLT